MASFHEAAPAVPESVGRLRRSIADFARAVGATEAAICALQLATSEAMSNVVVHAFADRDEPGTLTVTAARDGDEIRVVVCDDGTGMRPRPDSPGLGVGLPLMTRTARALHFRARPEGGTEVTMRFGLAAGL